MSLISRKPREKDTREIAFDARPHNHVEAAEDMLDRLRDPILEPRLGTDGPIGFEDDVLEKYAVDSNQPPRNCTCHPSDNPPRPCPRKHAFSECVKAAPLDYIASLVRSLTYGEMMDLSAALWSKREPDSEVTEKELPGIFHRWSAKEDST